LEAELRQNQDHLAFELAKVKAANEELDGVLKVLPRLGKTPGELNARILKLPSEATSLRQPPGTQRSPAAL
jgi:hypothetical protein